MWLGLVGASGGGCVAVVEGLFWGEGVSICLWRFGEEGGDLRPLLLLLSLAMVLVGDGEGWWLRVYFFDGRS